MTTRMRKAKISKVTAAKSVGKAAKPMKRARLQEVGNKQSTTSVRQLRETFGISRKMFARLVGFSERAVADWEADKPLSDVSSQRIKEIARLQMALADVMAKEFVGEWLVTPNDVLSGLKPIEIIERGEIDRVWRMIYQLESGMPT